jgi:hypothetical protein
MKPVRILFVSFLLLVFLAGMYVISTYGKKEEFSNPNPGGSGCPDLLVQKGNVLMLYNTNKPIVDGENPIPFFTLDDYIRYLEIQRKNGTVCPVLYLQQEYNTQGQGVYRMRPSPFDAQGGLPAMVTADATNATVSKQITKYLDANRANAPYNAGNHAGFDPQGLYIGLYTEIDQIHDSTKRDSISDNPMDPNWAGVTYTQQMVDSGKYEENNITKPVLFTANNVEFRPSLPTHMRAPVDIL